VESKVSQIEQVRLTAVIGMVLFAAIGVAIGIGMGAYVRRGLKRQLDAARWELAQFKPLPGGESMKHPVYRRVRYSKAELASMNRHPSGKQR
jgi:hypothetical protein